MFELLAVGAIGFWILVSIAAIFIFISLEYEEWGGTGATMTIIGTGVLFFFFGGRDIFTSIWDQLSNNTGAVFGYIGIYIVLGIIWSFVKWYFFLLGKRDKMKEEIKNRPSTFRQVQIPSASDYKGRLIAWMTYWPFSGIWTLVNDPVKRFFKWVYARFNNLYQSMSNNMFKGLQVEVAEAVEARDKAEADSE